MLEKKIHIIGCGPGSAEYLTGQAIQAVQNCEMVMGPEKLISLFKSLPQNVIYTQKDVATILKQIEDSCEDLSVGVLVSGDPGCFSLSRLVIEKFGMNRCRIIPGISSVQLALSRLGLAWTDAKVLSVHGRNPDDIISQIKDFSLVVILLGSSLVWFEPVLTSLTQQKKVYLMQNLGLTDEKITMLEYGMDCSLEISASSLLVIVDD
ncbi:MAG: precorrin-6y C5,15-methyltransferase (decarboxylating) subunit CbiE [Desulfovibrionales bacterium]|nr:precorrin-6y C5,15-methyltransferase (decarboxylating) subunit CbiE [Desulfovibrionales bacterium]